MALIVIQLLSRVRLFVTPWTAAHRASRPSPPPGACSNSCSLSHWCISSSDSPFSLCPQSFPASASFPLSWLFPSGGQSIGASASASVLPMNIQVWFPLGLTGLISLQSKGLSRVFSRTIVQRHEFFSTQVFFIVQLSHLYMTIGKTIALTIQTFAGKVMSLLLNTLSRFVIALLNFKYNSKIHVTCRNKVAAWTDVHLYCKASLFKILILENIFQVLEYQINHKTVLKAIF